ncbi:pentapeptide repeat-containing protein [Streptomyces sp. NPDC048269]|uniref:pentapeptide repeat-containing protein n=1 Tax=Streptomyces sp. NPDC048269 TaxID=3155753 RepID=UPI003422E956
MRDEHGRPCFGAVLFDGATFAAAASFDKAVFAGAARFDKTVFEGEARFGDAEFKDRAWFAEASFNSVAMFSDTDFGGPAWFDDSTFRGRGWFARCTFRDEAWFAGTTFSGGAWFDGATFHEDVRFDFATFDADIQFGPMACAKEVHLSRASFLTPVVVEVVAAAVVCRQTRWVSSATLRLRHATLDLTDAVTGGPLTVAFHPRPFVGRQRAMPLSETLLPARPESLQVTSLSGLDASHLVLIDADLTHCVFSATVHLDQLRLEGHCTFAPAPSGVHPHRGRLIRWTTRRTLAEEHYWRAAHGLPGWTPPAEGTPVLTLHALAPIYRHLRKSFEDAKNEPDAADFYYGEMEMRRHDRLRPRSERVLLAVYWGVSGYGMRASRALACLFGAMTVTLLLLMGLGLPDQTPKQEIKHVTIAGKESLVIDKTDPRLTSPPGTRFTAKRFDQALQVLANSVVFRSSGQNLTTWGTYIEMFSRAVEPVLLALAILAVRGRVKRG